MADFGLFVGFSFPARGREDGATKVFGEFVQFFTTQMQQGNIESFEPVFLQAHGGDLGGFFLVRGERPRLDQMVASDEFGRLAVRAQTTVEGFGVVNCTMGQELQRQIAIFLDYTADLRG